MILRILGEGQLEIPDGAIAELNRLDDALVAAVESGDEAQFSACLAALNARAHEVGQPLPDDYLGPSDFALPGDDATLEEVRDLLGDEGLVPG